MRTNYLDNGQTETLFAQEDFDTREEAEAYKRGVEAMQDFALEYCSDYTFRVELNNYGAYVSVVVWKVWEE
jgi:hypothetical protein